MIKQILIIQKPKLSPTVSNKVMNFIEISFWANQVTGPDGEHLTLSVILYTNFEWHLNTVEVVNCIEFLINLLFQNSIHY